uniref:Actin-interacting protein 1 n=1 Tax=Caenorhabditis japonica TaxID=281687 RepID=A0A8R1DIW0_CAEJA
MSEFSLNALFPSLPRTARGTAVVLGSTPTGDKIQFCNGTSVYTVPIDNLTNADIYTEHSHATTVAKTSPSGYYCASGDIHGNVRVWDTTQTTHILKITIPVFSGAVKDIAWDSESKRIAAVGEGKERFGHVFLFDTGTSNGNLTGQSRVMNSVDFKPSRPFRIISGSDDNTVAIFEGPPFKFKNAFHDHVKFVHSTRYNHDGSFFASTGGDGTLILYNGVDGTKVATFEDETLKGVAHSGSVFGLSWSPDGSKIATASADKTVKIWNASTQKVEKTIVIGTRIEDQQLGIIWTKKSLVSISANGFINFLNPELGTVDEVRYGHNKGITALTTSTDGKKLYSADAEGHISSWEIATGKSNRVFPDVHTTMITGISTTNKGDLFTVSWDDFLKIAPAGGSGVDSTKTVSNKLSSQPLGLAVSVDGEVAVAACYKHVAIYSQGKLTEVPINYNSSCVALSGDKQFVAVGGQDSKVHVYKLSGSSLSEVKTISHSAEITAVSFSKNNAFLVATDQSRKVIPYSVANNFEVASQNSWTFHTAKVASVSWSPDNVRLATGSLDNSIIVWNMNKASEHPIIIKGAHAMSSVNAVLWLDETTLVSAGQDSNIKFWNVPL